MITGFHGIGAYRGQRNPVALSRQITTALSGVEICIADRPIGAFGIVVGGECSALYDQDCWSTVGADGQRESTGWWNEVIEPRTQEEFEDFARECSLGLHGQHPRAYVEGWLSAQALRAVWVKDWAPEKTKRAARIIARHRGVPLLTVTGTTRIWEVLDRYKLPVRFDYWRKSA